MYRLYGRSRILAALAALWRGVFSERQLIVRSHGRIAYFRLSTGSQIGVAACLLAASYWVGHASHRYFAVNTTLADKDAALVRAGSDYSTVVAELGETRRRYDSVTRALQANHEHLLGVIERNHALTDGFARTEAALKADLDHTRGRLTEQLARTETILRAQMAERTRSHDEELAFTVRSLAETEEKRREAEHRTQRYLGEIAGLQARIRGLDETAVRLETSLAETRSALHSTDEMRQAAESERDRLRGRASDLEIRLSVLKKDQTELLNRIVSATLDDIEHTYEVIAATGLKAEELLGSDGAGTGGPFVPLPKMPPRSASFDTIVAALHSHIDRWDQLRRVMRGLPLASPLDHFRITSSFGKRKDPINGSMAIHEGLDMVSSYRAPVLSPAPGTVAVAGRNGRLGRFVEIDHGMGVRTRFAHMRTITVKTGEEVAFRQQIGQIGSSGRSTGPHLHYEILVNGAPVDPAQFLKAGKHVFERLYADN